jgi:hypothetical protein
VQLGLDQQFICGGLFIQQLQQLLQPGQQFPFPAFSASDMSFDRYLVLYDRIDISGPDQIEGTAVQQRRAEYHCSELT